MFYMRSEKYIQMLIMQSRFVIFRAVLHQLKSSYLLAQSFSLPRMQLWLEEMYSHPRGLLMSFLRRLRCAALHRWEQLDLCITKCFNSSSIFVKVCMYVVCFVFLIYCHYTVHQGCMNNISFGSERVGYYETVAGGAGAGPGWTGRSGVHSHMTNTRITDPEILEKRLDVF